MKTGMVDKALLGALLAILQASASAQSAGSAGNPASEGASATHAYGAPSKSSGDTRRGSTNRPSTGTSMGAGPSNAAKFGPSITHKDQSGRASEDNAKGSNTKQ